MASLNIKTKSLDYHSKNNGKIAITSKVKLENEVHLALAYTPGVAEPCKIILEKPNSIYKYTSKGNMVAVITNGTAVLGLGNIGPAAALPVMEGKALLFKKFAKIDSFPLCLKTKNSDKFVEIVKSLTTSFGAINLEDIKAPECFYIEKKLTKALDIPVFHDDQHGTAIVVASAIINCLRLTNKKIENLVFLQCGMGAAGTAIVNILKTMGAKKIIGFDKDGIINSKRKNQEYINDLLKTKKLFDAIDISDLLTALVGADVFIGASKENILTKEHVEQMNDKPWVFTLSNPKPEMDYKELQKTKAFIIASGRSDYPNQVNNALVFPGFFKGLLKNKIKKITNDMKIAAAYSLANTITSKELNRYYILPSIFNSKIVRNIVKSLSKFKNR